MEETVDFDSRKFLDSFKLTPEQNDSLLADYLGEDYVSIKENRIEKERVYQEAEQERFATQLDTEFKDDTENKYYKRATVNPEFIRRPIEDKEALDVSRRSLAKKSDWNIVTQKGMASLEQQWIINSLLTDPENSELQNSLASHVSETRKLWKEQSHELQEYQLELGEGIREGDLLSLSETVFANPLQTTKQIYEMGITFSPNIVGTIGGSIIGGPLGAIAISSGMLYAQEQLLWAEDWFQRHDYDMGNPQHVTEVFNDEKTRESLKLSMRKRGAAMAGIQAAFTVTLGLMVPGGAAAIARMARVGSKGKSVIGKGLSISGEVVSEMTTEYAGRGAALGFNNLTAEDRGEAFVEGLFSFLPAATRGMVSSIKEGVKNPPTVKVEKKEALPLTVEELEKEVREKASSVAEKIQGVFKDEVRKELETLFGEEVLDEALGESTPMTEKEKASIPDEMEEIRNLEKEYREKSKKEETKPSSMNPVSFEEKQKEPQGIDADKKTIRKSLNKETIGSFKELIDKVPVFKKISETIGPEQALSEIIFYQTVVPVKELEQEIKRAERSNSKRASGLHEKVAALKSVYKKITGKDYKEGTYIKSIDTKTSTVLKALKWKSIAEGFKSKENVTDISIFKKTLLSILSDIGRPRTEISQEIESTLSPKEITVIKNIQAKEDLGSKVDAVLRWFSEDEIKTIVNSIGIKNELTDVMFPEIFSEKKVETAKNSLEENYDERIKYADQKLREFKKGRGWKKWKIDLEPYLTGLKKWVHAMQLQEHLFQRLDGHEPDGLFSTIFRSVRKNYFISLEKLEKTINELRSKTPKDLFSDENILKEFKVKGLLSFKFKGINDLLWFLLNTGNSSNINGILDFEVHDPTLGTPKTTLRKILYYHFIEELKVRKIGRKEGFQRAAGQKSDDKRGTSYQLAQLVGDFNIQVISLAEAGQRVLEILNRIKKNSNNNIYNHPEIKQLIATIIHLEESNAIEWEKVVNIQDFNPLAYPGDPFYQKVIEPLLVGWLISNIEDVPNSAFRFIETVWNLFNNLNEAENEVLSKYGEEHGTITADIPLSLAPWVFIGGYFPLRSLIEDQIVPGSSVEGFSKGAHTRKRVSKPGIYPTNIDLDTILFSTIRSRIRNIYEFGSFFDAVTTIGPRSQTLNSFMTVFLPDVIPVINNWLDRVNNGVIYPVKKKDYITKIIKEAGNKSKTIVLAFYPKTIIEQQTGTAFKDEINAEELAEAYKYVTSNIKAVTKFINDKSVVMRNYNKEQMFELYRGKSERIIPVSALTKTGLKTKQVIEKKERVDQLVTNASYLGIVLSQGLVNKVLWWGTYNKVLNKGIKYNGKVWPPGNEALAIDVADAAVIRTQASFSPVDVSTLQANPYAQLIRPFMSFHSTKFNHTMTFVDKAIKNSDMTLTQKQKSILYMVVFASVIAATPSFVWYQILKKDDDDEDKTSWYYNYIYYVAEYYLTVLDMGTPLAPISPFANFHKFLSHPEYAYRDFMADTNILGLDFIQSGLYSAQGIGNLLEGEKLSPQGKDIGNIPDLKDWQKKKIAFGIGYLFPPAFNGYKLYKRMQKEPKPKSKSNKQKWN